VALIALFFYSTLAYLLSYVAEVFPSSPIASPGSDGCTHSFFISGSAGCHSSCCAAPIVVLFALSLGSP
jgi:hypothetical protein